MFIEGIQKHSFYLVFFSDNLQSFILASELKAERTSTKRISSQLKNTHDDSSEDVSLIKVSRKARPSSLAPGQNTKQRTQHEQDSSEYLNIGSSSEAHGDDEDEDGDLDVYMDSDDSVSSDYLSSKSLDKRRHYLIESEHLHLQKGIEK